MSRAASGHWSLERHRLTYLFAAWGLVASLVAARNAVAPPVLDRSATPSPIVVVRQNGTLPVEYYLTDSESHAERVRAMFAAVNDIRRVNGEPPLRVVMLGNDVSSESFRQLVDPLPDAPPGGVLRVVIHDLRVSCGPCEPDPVD